MTYKNIIGGSLMTSAVALISLFAQESIALKRAFEEKVDINDRPQQQPRLDYDPFPGQPEPVGYQPQPINHNHKAAVRQRCQRTLETLFVQFIFFNPIRKEQNQNV